MSIKQRGRCNISAFKWKQLSSREMQPRYGVEEHACTHILQLCVLYMRPHGYIYIYITYIHNHIYIYIYHIHECVNAHVSQANALLKLNTRPLKKNSVQKIMFYQKLDENGSVLAEVPISSNFCQFFPQLKSQVLWMKSPLKGT